MHTHTLTPTPQLREHIHPLPCLQDGGFPREEGVDVPPTLQEGRGLPLYLGAILEDAESISIIILPHVILLVHLKQTNPWEGWKGQRALLNNPQSDRLCQPKIQFVRPFQICSDIMSPQLVMSD